MAFITFDYRCDNCGAEYPDKMVLRKDVEAQRCDKCKAVLRRLPAGPITTFKFGDRSAIKSKKAVSLMDKH